MVTGAGAGQPKTIGNMALARRSSRSGVQSVVLVVLGMAVMRLRDQGCHIGAVVLVGESDMGQNFPFFM